MKFFWKILAVAAVFFVPGNADYDTTQMDIVMSMAEYFTVASCIVQDEKKQDFLRFISNESYPSKRSILTGSLTFSEIWDLLRDDAVGKTMIVLKMDNKTLASLGQLSESENFSSAIWVLFSDGPVSAQDLQGVYIPFDSEFMCVESNGSFFWITEFYQIDRNSSAETFVLGNWTEESGLVLADLTFYARRNNLKGHQLKGAIKNDPPYVFGEKDEEGNLKFGGYLYEIWSELEFRINFSTKFPDEFLEKSAEDALSSGEAEFVLARIASSPSAFQSMDFSQPINEAKFYMFGHRPGSELDWDSYLKPFSPNTWLINFVWMVSSSLALTLLYKIAWDFGTSEREARYFIFTFSESLLTVFRAVCMQGSDVTPRSNSCRLLFLSIYLTALVVTSAFSAALFSLLTIPKPRSPFNSLDEVISNRKYKIGLPSDPDFHTLVENFSETLQSSTQKKLLEKVMDSKEKIFLSPEEGLERLCHDKSYVFLFDLPNVLYLMQNMTKSCQDKILPSGAPLFTEYIGFGFKKKYPYKKLIDFHLIRMKNEGILNRLLLNYWPPQIPTVQATWVRVTLSDISPILYMFALGAVAGTVLLYAEKILLHLKKSNVYRGRSSITDHFVLRQCILSRRSASEIPSEWEMYFAECGKKSSFKN